MDADCRGPVWAVLLIGLLLGGCNVFEGATPIPSTVDALLSDARTALAVGNPARAVRLLERAYQKDSTDVRVRVALGNALYSEQGLDVFALRAAAAHLVDSTRASGASGAGSTALGNNDVCTDDANPPAASDRYARIGLDVPSVRRWADHASVVDRVQALVVDGVLGRRAAAFEAASGPVRRKGYLVGSVTAVAGSVLGVRRVARTTGSALYLDRDFQPTRALIACARGNAGLKRIHTALCALSDAARQGARWLRVRNRLAGREGEAALLVDRLLDLADAASARTSCS